MTNPATNWRRVSHDRARYDNIFQETYYLARDCILFDPTDAHIIDTVEDITRYRLTPTERRFVIATYNAHDRSVQA